MPFGRPQRTPFRRRGSFSAAGRLPLNTSVRLAQSLNMSETSMHDDIRNVNVSGWLLLRTRPLALGRLILCSVAVQFGFDCFALQVQTLRCKLGRVKKIRPSRASKFPQVQCCHGIPLPSIIQGIRENAACSARTVHVRKSCHEIRASRVPLAQI
jgi:hypothetical protein